MNKTFRWQNFAVFSSQDFSMGFTELKGTLTSVDIMVNKKTVERLID